MDNTEVPGQGVKPDHDWRDYDWYRINHLVLKEFFEVSYYINCVRKAKIAAPQTIQIHKTLKIAVAHEEDLDRWSNRMDREEYQDLYSSALIRMWSAFEAGLENIIARYIENDKELAEQLVMFTRVKFDMSLWPWRMDERLRIAAKLDRRAAEGPSYMYLRLGRLFSYIGIQTGPCFASSNPEANPAGDLDEANRIRNIILHRYGEPDETDVELFPAFGPWLNKNLPVTKDMFHRYYMAIIVYLSSVQDGIELAKLPKLDVT